MVKTKIKKTAGPLVKRVAIFGFANSGPEEEIYQDVHETARYLAERGYTIVNGGGPGLMLAATQGAESVKGAEVVTVTFDPKFAPGFEGRFGENVPTREIKTTNYIERMFTLMRESDYFVIFNGGTGTLSEFATAWVLAKLYQGHHKGFALYGHHWRPVVDSIVNHMFTRPHSTDVFEIVNSPRGVLSAIGRYEKEMGAKDLPRCEDVGDEAPFMACRK